MTHLTSRSYTWPIGCDKPEYPRIFLEDDAYAKAMQALVIACSDVAVFTRSPNLLWLAHRNNKPMDTWWVMGGRWIPGENEITAAQRHFKRDAGTVLSTNRLIYLGRHHYYMAERQQEPQDVAWHSCADTFAVEVNPDELSIIAAKIALPEYVPNSLEGLPRERLTQPDIHPAMLDIYDSIFKG